jgi:iron complex outermembrane receptor protein
VSKFAYAALCGAALSLVVSAPAGAQDAAAITAGGDVTAEEATPLPPVVVEAPSQPLRRKVKTAKPATGTVTVAPDDGAEAGEGVAEPGVGLYTLGQLDLIGGSTVTNEAMYTFNKNTLDQALSIVPGVSVQQSGNSRNERDVQVRGFDRFRVPLYMDGVRIYLPADNRLDFNRFLTADIAEVQVQKGYVSVLNGPGGLGGAINLVSRKPTKEVEMEGRVGAVFDGDLGSMGQWSTYAFAGTRQKGYYAQVSGTIIDQDHFDMSGDFTPSAGVCVGFPACQGYPYENGGARDHSDSEDWRINTKVGITPNATDEYSINYTTQANNRGSPLHVNRQIVQGYNFGATERHWTWDDWSTSTLSWMSKTKLGDASYIKTNAYWNNFGSDLFFHNNRSYSTIFINSVYDDHSVGGFVEMGTELIPMNTLKGVIHYRQDVHKEWDLDYETAISGPFLGRSPVETSREETWSFAAENTFHALRNLDFVTGVSYDTNQVMRADFTESATPTILRSQPERPEVNAWNWQGAAILDYSATGTAHASVSSRTRFPTLFERYSTRFGTRAVDPNLEPERATNYEVGASDLFGNVKVSGALFYSDIEDNIQNAFFAANGMTSIIGFNADGETYGLELSADWDVTRTLRVGGNYTYIERDFDYAKAAREFTPFGTAAQMQAQVGSLAAYQAEGTPAHKAFLYLAWQATRQLTLTPSLELSSDRTVLITDCRTTLTINNPNNLQNTGGCPNPRAPANARPNFTDIGSYALLNFRADYDFTDNFSTAVGVTNLLDQNYSLADGFPEPGRQFYATARARF